MEKKSIGNYLEHRLNGKEDQEGVFNLLLRIGKASRKGCSVRAHCHLLWYHHHARLPPACLWISPCYQSICDLPHTPGSTVATLSRKGWHAEPPCATLWPAASSPASLQWHAARTMYLFLQTTPAKPPFPNPALRGAWLRALHISGSPPCCLTLPFSHSLPPTESTDDFTSSPAEGLLGLSWRHHTVTMGQASCIVASLCPGLPGK